MRKLRELKVEICLLILCLSCVNVFLVEVQAQEILDPIEDYVVDQIVLTYAQNEVTISGSSFTDVPDLNVTLTGINSDSILDVKYFCVVKVPIAAASFFVEFGFYEPAGIEAGPWVNQSSGADMWMAISWSKIFQRNQDPLPLKVVARHSNDGSFQVYDRRLEVTELVPKSTSAGELSLANLYIVTIILILLVSIPIAYKAGKKTRNN